MHFQPSWADKELLVLGCGNVLFGDDGFGPALAEYMNGDTIPNHVPLPIPGHALVLDAGSSVRDILFDVVLSEKVPRRIVVADALDCGRNPGEVFELSVDDIPAGKLDDFSIHQVPTSNLLRELRDHKGVDVRILAAQPAHIPADVKPGLSSIMQQAVVAAAEVLRDRYLKE